MRPGNAFAQNLGPEEWTGKMAEFCGRMQEAQTPPSLQLLFSLRMLTEIAVVVRALPLAEDLGLAHKGRKPERAHIS
ncbi:hypothetical protein QTL95_14190 [Rhizobium sp. S152]|uniref:hypothetical protein n=1 Tax=Rhizobium sp. S152 TaxID=3055038 RepID=UPI0025A9BF94|nr:hypothetical protein [Rhizobium sp. S152]MDM9627053.1 hypothetical protein [Rhizobium sp. S152]